ncbi:TPR-like protein [Lichtheimia hyalospora FSU 10163]|nr:TPR-like protein [Lichtheimia hyalospora FSU 10163]
MPRATTRAINFYKEALKHNADSVNALSRLASLYRDQDQLDQAVKYFKRVLTIDENHGETWSALGHCHLMMENLGEAYHAYQQALSCLPNPKDPKLWYGIGILYDRYGSLEYAEEAFSAVIHMDNSFEKVNEIYFRLGIIYKQQQKYDLSLQCFRYILANPPQPLTQVDIWYQMGHVYEQQREFERAKEAYERVLAHKPEDAKVLQQYGWLFHQPDTSFSSGASAIDYLTRSLKSDSNDAQSWYLLGRCYIAEQNYNKAYEAYQQAVYRDARNPAFWCSIGVLYYRINQYRDALDAYNRAIRLAPYMSEVWYNLGTLYEASNNQVQDALDAYQRAAQIDTANTHIRERIEYLRGGKKGESKPPQVQDIGNPYQFQSSTRGSASPTPPSYLHGYQQPTCQESHAQGVQVPTSIPQLPIAPPPPPVTFASNENDIKTCPTSPVPRKRTLSMQLNTSSPIHQHDEMNARGIRSSTVQPISPEEPDRKRKRDDHPTKQPLENNDQHQQQLSTPAPS